MQNRVPGPQARSIDAYALWVFSPTLQLRVTASNLNPRDYVTGGSVDSADPVTPVPLPRDLDQHRADLR